MSGLAMAELAWDYASQPSVRDSDWHMWRQLATAHVRLAGLVRKRLTVFETDTPDPYPHADAMLWDIRQGVFAVSRANCAHPAWSPSENVAFRIVHDVLGHCAANWGPCTGDERRAYSFAWSGETLACRAHARYISRDLWPALLTECLGQVAWSRVLGMFDEQKVARVDANPEAWLA